MTIASRYSGFASLDALLSLLPFAIMLLLLIEAVSSESKGAEESFTRQQVFDNVASAADFTVKVGAARHEGGVRYPNWIDPDLLTQEYSDSLRRRAGLSALYIGLDPPDGEYPVCIYRLAVAGDGKDIRKLYVCGG